MKRIFLVWIGLALLAAACTPPLNVAATSTATATPVATLAPTVTLAATQKAPPTSTAVPLPTIRPTSPTRINATPLAPNCADLPGFGACNPALPLSGRLAWLDAAAQTITLLDFDAKQAWTFKTASPVEHLVWQDANWLLAYNQQEQPALVWANPAQPGSFALPQLSPQGTPVFRAANFNAAWLEMKDTQFFVHVRLGAAGEEQVWPAGPPGDQIYRLLGWAPGTSLLLGGRHFSSNSMWVNGDRLFTLDAVTGKSREFEANARLGEALSWHPSQAGLMTFADSNQAPVMGAARLAVLDVTSGQVTHPIADEFITSSNPVWTPDGKAIVHAAARSAGPGPAQDPFALAGIFLTQWPDGATRRVTQPPAGERDDWPHLLADGVHFLYLRVAADASAAQLRLGALDGSLDAAVVERIAPLPPAPPFAAAWNTRLVYAP